MSETTRAATAGRPAAPVRARLSVRLRRDWFLYALLALPIGYFLLFHYGPMYGVVVAFQDYNIFKGILEQDTWVGLEHFRTVFGMSYFRQVVRNTFVLNGLELVLGFPAPIILALMINELTSRRFKRAAQTTLYLPHFISWTIVGGLAVQMLATNTGLVNTALAAVGVGPVPFLTDQWVWLFSYTGIAIWKSAGWGTILYLAAMSNINVDLYDAAAIDGAGRWRQTWHVTLPEITPTIVILLILTVGRLIQIGLEQPYMLKNVLVAEFADVISIFVYNIGLRTAQFEIATAVGLFQSVVGMILLVAANTVIRRMRGRGIW